MMLEMSGFGYRIIMMVNYSKMNMVGIGRKGLMVIIREDYSQVDICVVSKDGVVS